MPPRLSAADFDQELLILFDAYVHGDLDRRGFLAQAQKFATASVTAAGLLAALSPNFAAGQQVARDDPRLKTERVVMPSPNGSGSVKGYLVRPANAGAARLPAVLVVHENRGLNPHIEDIARRLALEGFMALAPDALSPLGGYPGDEDKAREAFTQLDMAKTQQDFLAAASWLHARADADGKLGAVGFCWGGGLVHVLAARMPDLNAAVAFYGNAPPVADAARVKAPLLVHLAGNDPRINAAWPAYEAALKAAGVKLTVYQYPGTQHGFNNDTTPRYDPAAAKLAWERTVAFLQANLQGQTADASRPVRVRGTIQSVSPDEMVVKTRAGDQQRLALAQSLKVNEVYPIDISQVNVGSYIGVASLPQGDGVLRAVALTVFPEAARGTAEGHRPFDLGPQSTMTNATVAEVVREPQGRRLHVRYRDGEQTIIVPTATPIVTFHPAGRALLVPGASVSVVARVAGGTQTTDRVNVGRKDFVPPY